MYNIKKDRRNQRRLEQIRKEDSRINPPWYKKNSVRKRKDWKSVPKKGKKEKEKEKEMFINVYLVQRVRRGESKD